MQEKVHDSIEFLNIVVILQFIAPCAAITPGNSLNSIVVRESELMKLSAAQLSSHKCNMHVKVNSSIPNQCEFIILPLLCKYFNLFINFRNKLLMSSFKFVKSKINDSTCCHSNQSF